MEKGEFLYEICDQKRMKVSIFEKYALFHWQKFMNDVFLLQITSKVLNHGIIFAYLIFVFLIFVHIGLGKVRLAQIRLG